MHSFELDRASRARPSTPMIDKFVIVPIWHVFSLNSIAIVDVCCRPRARQWLVSG